MLTNSALLLALALAVAEPGDHPAPSAVRGSQFPQLHANGTVTFRVTAPNARQVQVNPRGTGNGLGDKPLDMTKGAGGAWTVTAPVRPGFHYYQLLVDGFPCNDPSSRTFFGWAQDCSGLEVPDPALDFYSHKEVPHGQVRVCTYHAKTTAGPREAYVYTPPGYDEDPSRRYPVLYLQHGAGESQRAWTEQGKAHLILDNLLAAKQAEPMLVVMENGYATPPGQAANPADRSQSENFTNLIVNDLIPFIDANFRTLKDREHRAIAGLSMGGGQAMRSGLTHLDQFASVAALSGAVRDFNLETSYGGALRDAATANQKLRLLWIGCGTEDRLIQSARDLHESLTRHQINHAWYEISGSHEWQVWRKHLHDLAPRLFRGQGLFRAQSSVPAQDVVHQQEKQYRVLAQDRGHIAIVNALGAVEWEVECKHNSHDIARLANGNYLLHTGPTTVVEMTPGKEIVWRYEAKPKPGYTGRVEVHAFQRLPSGLTLVAESGNRRLVEVDASGSIVKEIPLVVEKPDPHRDTRLARRLPSGHYLVCHEGDGAVREYDESGKVVWTYRLDLAGRPRSPGHGPEGHGTEVFGALRLPSGNTLIACGNGNRVIEVTPAGQTVWSIEQDELPGIKLAWVTTLQLLPNGNLIVGNTHAGESNPQLFEVTRDKKVVWKFTNFQHFGNSTAAAMILDQSDVLR